MLPCTYTLGGVLFRKNSWLFTTIAIARALLRNRSIMLFDEATSALDPDTERRLLANILADNSKTIIFITHRMAVTDYCHDTLRL